MSIIFIKISCLKVLYLRKLLSGKSFLKEMVLMLDNTALIIVIIGALNWLCIGIFGFDVVAALFGGQGALLSRIVYTLVGIAGIWSITLLFKDKTPVRNNH